MSFGTVPRFAQGDGDDGGGGGGGGGGPGDDGSDEKSVDDGVEKVYTVIPDQKSENRDKLHRARRKRARLP